MPNGHAVRLSIVPKIPLEQPPKADAASAPAQIEEMAPAVAAAAGMLGKALCDFWASGAMAPGTRLLAGERIAKLYELRQAIGERDFPAAVHREYRRHMQGCDPEWLHENEQAVGEVLGHLIAIVDKVAAVEQGWVDPMPFGRN